MELLAFHRIKRRSQNVCRVCIDESQVREKECFVCGRPYTEKNGPCGPPKGETAEAADPKVGMDENFKAMMASTVRHQKQRDGAERDAEPNPEERKKMEDAIVAKWRAKGIAIIED